MGARSSTPRFTRRDYEWLADTVRSFPVGSTTHRALVEHFADALEATNQAFDRDRFVARCTNGGSLTQAAACAECGHLHYEGYGIYTTCPIDGCDCEGQS